MNRRMAIVLSRTQGHSDVPAKIKRAGCLDAAYSLSFFSSWQQLYLY
jgi:hypothetical protein